MSAEVRPVLLFCRKGIESAGENVSKMVFFNEIRKILMKALPGIGKTRRGRKAGSGTDQNRVGILKILSYFSYLLRVSSGRSDRPDR